MLELRGEVRTATPNRAPRDDGKPRHGRRLARIAWVVRREIAPRLQRVHSRAAAHALPFEDLSRALVDNDEGATRGAFARLSVASDDHPSIRHGALASGPRRQGEGRRGSACDVFTVSQGVARLQALLATLAGPAMLMLTAPGHTHRFGAEMAADLFRREGWRVEQADGDLLALGAQTFDAASVSCGYERAAASLSQVGDEIKARLRGRRTPILPGGALFWGQLEAANPITRSSKLATVTLTQNSQR